jgi:hypothetical protein
MAQVTHARRAAAGARVRGVIVTMRDRMAAIDPQRVLLRVGAFLLPTGIVVVLLGWYGAAHTPYLFEQVPYILSGGLLGLTLAIAGGFIYFGTWLGRLGREGREQAALTAAAIARITALVDPSTPTGPDRAAVLVITPRGSLVHRATCPIVASRDDVEEIDDPSGKEGCKLCLPLLG